MYFGEVDDRQSKEHDNGQGGSAGERVLPDGHEESGHLQFRGPRQLAQLQGRFLKILIYIF